MSTKHHEDEPAIRLARDEFTSRRRELAANPGAVSSTVRIDIEDHYGNVTTWNLDLFRVAADVTAFVQRGAADEYQRFVMPPAVTAAIIRHHAGLVTKSRRKTARRVVADRLARGERLGNPDALQRARATRKGSDR